MGLGRIVAGVLLSTVIFSTASISASMSDYVNNVVIKIDEPSVIEGQKANMINFGGARLELSSPQTFQPFRIVPPSIRAGCRGIDISFGAFSYLGKPEYLVSFFEKSLSQAGAYFFQLAFNALCPSCSKLLNTLTGLANQINALGMNSCQMGMLLANYTFNAMSNYVDVGANSGWVDVFNSKLNSLSEVIADFSSRIATYLSSAQVNAIINNGSLLRYVEATNSNASEITNILRDTVGDIVFEHSGNDKCLAAKRYGPYLDLSKELIMASVTACDQQVVSIRLPTGKTVSMLSLCFKTKQKIDSIIQKIENKQPLSDDDLKFLATYPIPVFKLIRIYAPYPYVLKSLSIPLARYTAASIVSLILPKYIYQVMDGLNSIEYLASMNKLPVDCETSSDKLLTKIRKYRDDLKQIIKSINIDTRSIQEEVMKSIESANTIVELERNIYSKFSDSPIVASYMYSKFLGSLK